MCLVQTFARLSLACLTDDRAAHCGYRFTVSNAGTAHTAFRTQQALMRWLDLRGLRLADYLPDPGQHAFIPIIGEYRSEYGRDASALQNMTGPRIRLLDNGEYTQAVVRTDPDGIRTVSRLLPSVPRETFGYEESRRMEDAGAA